MADVKKLPMFESDPEPETPLGKSGMVIAYMATSFSGFLVGLLCGWLIWG